MNWVCHTETGKKDHLVAPPYLYNDPWRFETACGRQAYRMVPNFDDRFGDPCERCAKVWQNRVDYAREVRDQLWEKT